MYVYRATLIRVVDGDTVWLDVDLGFDVRRRDSFRLYGIDAPEMGTPEGTAAKAWLLEELGVPGSPLLVRTLRDKREKYGRYLALLFHDEHDDQAINHAMVAAGHATSYMAVHGKAVREGAT